jgi:hypothetical protein
VIQNVRCSVSRRSVSVNKNWQDSRTGRPPACMAEHDPDRSRQDAARAIDRKKKRPPRLKSRRASPESGKGASREADVGVPGQASQAAAHAGKLLRVRLPDDMDVRFTFGAGK